MQTLQHIQTLHIKDQIDQVIDQVKDLKKNITEVIDSYQWRSDEYIQNNIIEMEDMELELIGVIIKLTKMQEAI